MPLKALSGVIKKYEKKTKTHTHSEDKNQAKENYDFLA